MDFYVRGLTLKASHRLMDQYARLGKRVPFAFGPCTEKQSAHARSLPDAYGLDLRLDVLQCVIYRQSRCYLPAGGIDVKVDVFVRFFTFEKKKLGDDQISNNIIYRGTQEHDSFLEKPGVNIIRSFAAAGLFYYYRYEHYSCVSSS
jgi:hypothetical protein